MIAVAAMLLVRVTVVLLLAALLVRVAARQSAALRHVIWTSAVLGSAALVMAPWLLPQFAVLPTLSILSSLPARPPASWLSTVLGAVWVVGTTALLVRLAVGLYSLRQVTRCATSVPSTSDAHVTVATRHGPAATAVLLATVRSPSCWGIRRPAILLPLDADTWNADHRRHVLSHELAHLQRQDPLWRLARHIACALCWYHPLMWRVSRLADEAAEEATDNVVLAGGEVAADYARSLVASAIAPRHALLSSFAREHALSGRIRAILDGSVQRAAPKRMRVVGSVGVLCVVTMTLGSLAPTAPRATAARTVPVAAMVAPVPRQSVAASAAPAAQPASSRRVRSATRARPSALRSRLVTAAHSRDVLDRLDDPALQFDQRRRAAILAEALQSTTFSRAQVERFLAALCGLPSGRVRARLLAQVLQRPNSDALVRGALPIIHGLPSSRDRGLRLVQASARGDLSTEETMLDDLAANAVRRGEGVTWER
ncbi:MAG: M56 family metallopeptidase [Gemmatimonadaceae bacterium]|nr:M56 family metallopeptidase [Gemmatimonadaceae bacterium]